MSPFSPPAFSPPPFWPLALGGESHLLGCPTPMSVNRDAIDNYRATEAIWIPTSPALSAGGCPRPGCPRARWKPPEATSPRPRALLHPAPGLEHLAPCCDDWAHSLTADTGTGTCTPAANQGIYFGRKTVGGQLCTESTTQIITHLHTYR